MKLENAPKLAMHVVFCNEHISLLVDEVSDYIKENNLNSQALWNIVFETSFDVKDSRTKWYCHLYHVVDNEL